MICTLLKSTTVVVRTKFKYLCPSRASTALTSTSYTVYPCNIIVWTLPICDISLKVGWGYSPVAECLPRRFNTLLPRAKRREEKKKGGKEGRKGGEKEKISVLEWPFLQSQSHWFQSSLLIFYGSTQSSL